MSGKKSLDNDSYDDETSESSHTKNTQPRRRNSVQTSPRMLPTREGDIRDEEDHIGYENSKISGNIDARKNMSSPEPAGKTFRNHSELKEKQELELEKYSHRDPHKDIRVPLRTQDTEDDNRGNDLYDHNMRDVRIDSIEKSDIYGERKKSKDNISNEHVGSDSDSDIAPGRKVGKQDGIIGKKEGPNKVCTENISHNKDMTDFESDQHYESNFNGKPVRKDVENINQRRFTSKEKLERNMPKYIEKSESDSSDCTRSEKQIQREGNETYLENVAYLPNRKSGVRGEEVDQFSNARKAKTAQSCSESDTDSDNHHSKNVKDQREVRHDSTKNSSKKGWPKERNKHREHEDDSMSEFSDGFVADKEIFRREEAYLKNAPRRKNVISQNARGCESDSYEQPYTLKGKAKHQINSDEDESYSKGFHKQMENVDRNSEDESYSKGFHKQMENIDRNTTKRNELDSHSNRRSREEHLSGRNPKEDDDLGYSKEKYPTNREGKSTYTESDSDSKSQGVRRENFKHQQNSDEEESYGKRFHKKMENIDRNSTKRNELDSRSNRRPREEHLSGRNPKEDDDLGYSNEKYPPNREGKSTYTGSDSNYQGFRREKFSHQQNSDEEESYEKSFHKPMESINGNSTERNELDSHSNLRARGERLSGRNPKEDVLGYSKEKYPIDREGKSTYTGSDSESKYQGFRREKFKHQQNSDEEESYGKRFHKQMENIDRNSTKRNELDSRSNRRAREEHLSGRNPKEDDDLGYSNEKYPPNREGKSTYTGSDSNYQGFRREKFSHQQDSDEEVSYEKSFHKPMESINRNSTERNDFDSHSNLRTMEERSGGKNPKENDVLGYSKEKYPINRGGKSTYTESDSESKYQGLRREKFKYQHDSDEEVSYEKSFHKPMESINRNSTERNDFDSHSNLRTREERSGGRNPKEDDVLGYSKEKYPINRGGKSTYTGSDSESKYQSFRREKFKHQQNSDEEESYGKSFLNNKRKEASQYENCYDYSRDVDRRSNEMRRETSEFTHYDSWEKGQDHHHHHIYGMSRERRHADLDTHDKRKAQAARPYEQEDGAYSTRRPVDDEDDTHYQKLKGQNRKPPFENSYKLRNPTNGSDWDEENRYHNYRRSPTDGRFDKSDVNKQIQGLSVEFLINLLLQKKKLKASMNSLMKVGLGPKDVSSVMHENSHLFKVSTSDLDETIYLRPQIDICHAHVSTGCSDRHSCRNLHICPRYIQLLCNKPDCVLGHKLRSRHNVDILEDFYLDEFPGEKVLELLRLSLPHVEIAKHLKVCNDYVSRKCKTSKCVGLHICQEYLLQMSCNTRNCQLNHNLLDQHNCQILESFGIDTNESPRDVMKVIKDEYPSIFKQQLSYSSSKSLPKPAGRQQSGGRDVEPTKRLQSESRSNDKGNRNRGKEFMKTPTISASSENYQFGGTTQQLNTTWYDYYQGNTLIPEICYYSVSGKCRYEEEGCKRLHANRHFHWQVRLKGKVWINLRDHQVQVLERSYCDPAQEGVAIPPVDHSNCPKEMLNLFGRESWQAHFTAMVLRNAKNQTLELRRICSENVNGNVKCTRCLWYFLDQNNVWIQYGNTDTTNRNFLASDVTSEDIEKKYLSNPNASITFKNSMFTYLLDFNSMTQTNTSSKVTRKVRRRPQPHLKTRATWPFGFFKQS